MLEQKALQGLHILVTRPTHQAGAFKQLIEQAGATAHLIPLIEIQSLELIAEFLEKINQPNAYQLIIFISTNAVEHGLTILPRSLLTIAQLGAIGKATAATLRAHGLYAKFVPEAGFRSEDFLALPDLQQLDGQRVLIVRGLGGRELLAQTLQQRGAQVDYADVYKRICPPSSVQRLKQLQQSTPLDIIALTSSEGLYYLAETCTDAAWHAIPLLVGSQRTALEAQALGFQRLIVAENPSDSAMFTALLRWQGITND